MGGGIKGLKTFAVRRCISGAMEGEVQVSQLRVRILGVVLGIEVWVLFRISWNQHKVKVYRVKHFRAWG